MQSRRKRLRSASSEASGLYPGIRSIFRYTSRQLGIEASSVENSELGDRGDPGNRHRRSKRDVLRATRRNNALVAGLRSSLRPEPSPLLIAKTGLRGPPERAPRADRTGLSGSTPRFGPPLDSGRCGESGSPPRAPSRLRRPQQRSAPSPRIPAAGPGFALRMLGSLSGA